VNNDNETKELSAPSEGEGTEMTPAVPAATPVAAPIVATVDAPAPVVAKEPSSPGRWVAFRRPGMIGKIFVGVLRGNGKDPGTVRIEVPAMAPMVAMATTETVSKDMLIHTFPEGDGRPTDIKVVKERPDALETRLCFSWDSEDIILGPADFEVMDTIGPDFCISLRPIGTPARLTLKLHDLVNPDGVRLMVDRFHPRSVAAPRVITPTDGTFRTFVDRTWTNPVAFRGACSLTVIEAKKKK
jgi:hypothetical protein